MNYKHEEVLEMLSDMVDMSLIELMLAYSEDYSNVWEVLR